MPCARDDTAATGCAIAGEKLEVHSSVSGNAIADQVCRDDAGGRSRTLPRGTMPGLQKSALGENAPGQSPGAGYDRPCSLAARPGRDTA